MTWKLLTWPPLILVLLLCPIEDSSAQTTTSGGLGGVVSDPSGAVVPGALAELRDNAKGTVHLARTDSDGAYRFFFLAPGKYTLKVVHESFREQRHEISVVLGPPSTRNVSLELAAAVRRSK